MHRIRLEFPEDLSAQRRAIDPDHPDACAARSQPVQSRNAMNPHAHAPFADVVSLGALAMDYYGLVVSLPHPGEKISALGHEVHPGGVAGNVMTQLARLGVRTGWIGKIGDDETGALILREFEREGIDRSHVQIEAGEQSMFTWILVDHEGERTIVMFPNTLVKLTGADVAEKHSEYIAAAKILHAEICALPLEPVAAAMRIARNSGVTTVFDLDVTPHHFIEEARLGTRQMLEEVLSLTDVLVPCKAAAAELLGSENLPVDAAWLMDYGPRAVVITLGAEGSLYVDRHQSFKSPGIPVKAVDTTGAGDAFHGGLIYGLLNGLAAEQTCELANACGAYCCTGIGARAMGTRGQIVTLLAESTGRKPQWM